MNKRVKSRPRKELRESTTPQHDPIDEGPAPIFEDPMKELFTEDGFEPDYSVPDEVQAAFDFYDIGAKDYRCQLKRLDNEEGSEDKASYIRSWAKAIPPTDWIGTVYGPGAYILQIQWRGYDPESDVKKLKWMSQRIRIKIDDSYEDSHEDYLLKKQVERAQKRKKTIDKAKLRNALESNIDDGTSTVVAGDPKESAIQYLKEFRENAQELGFVQNAGIDWQSILKVALPVMPAILNYFEQKQQQQQQQQQQFITMLMSTMSSNNNQMLDLVKNQNTNPVQSTGTEMMKEMRDMVFGAIDIKKAINGDKESVIDRIGGAVEKVLPTIIELSAMSKAQREQDYRYNMAQTMVNRDPAFQQVLNDPELQVAAIKRWDEFFGWEQTDAILKVAGIERDENVCPRTEEQRLPRGSREQSNEVTEDYNEDDTQD